MKQLYTYLSWLLVVGLFTQCNPYQEAKVDIGEPPVASFSVTPDAEQNYFNLTATTPGAFMYDWDLGNGLTAEGKEVRAFYQKQGSYQVTLTVFSKGGHSITSQTITVDQDVSLPCQGAIEDLTNCSSKSWVLDPSGGALVVGPPDGSVWWEATAQTASDRPCAFNDEFIFYEDGTYEYKTNGDVWVDEEGGSAWPTDIGLPIGCTDDSNWPAKYIDWLSGTFSYTFVDNPAGSTITLTGTGAHLGLYKVGNTGTVAEPQPSTTYPIVELTQDKLSVQFDFSWGYWRFTFVPK